MKKIALIFLSLIITLSVFAQETDAELDEMKKELKSEKDDTTNIRFRRKTVKIVEDNGETKIFVNKRKRKDKDDWNFFWDDDNRFKGSWSGFSVGMSNFVDKDFSLSRSGADEFMDLNTSRSWNMNLNFAQYSINLVNNKLGLVTGLGLEWNYYRFDNDNSIQENADGEIVNFDLSVAEPDWNIEKSRLNLTYATVPLLLEFHSSSSQHRGFVFAAGVIGGVKLGANTKVIYKEDGDKKKDKTKDDYNLSPFRYGFHAKIGFGDWLVYGTYYMTPLFESGKGPELYPFSVGIGFSFE